MSGWIERIRIMSDFTQHLHDFADFTSQGGFMRQVHRLARGVNAMAGNAVRRPRQPSSSPSHNSEDDSTMQDISVHAVYLGPAVKRHIFKDFPGVPKDLLLGWAQLPQFGGHFFSIGVFLKRQEFCQIALADGKGRVFLGHSLQMDTHELDPVLIFGKEGDSSLHDDARMSGRSSDTLGDSLGDTSYSNRGATSTGQGVTVLQGGIVGRDMFGRMTWLASWLEHDKRYTLEQMRYNLPESLRLNLEYRDAVAIAFFASYMLPQMEGSLIGFGAGNIFRRLNREAPLGAIRRSVRDSLEARAHGMRVSGLEDYFADLMRESGALKPSTGLEAVHGAEPLHLYTSSYSGAYFFTWDDSLDLVSALEALNIEGNLNRFAAVSAWLEQNSHIGASPIEDTVTRAQAARIDHALLENPALLALKPSADQVLDLHEPSSMSLSRLLDAAARTSNEIALKAPLSNIATQHAAKAYGAQMTGCGEWVYRQAVSILLRRLRLPYRFDTEFRSNLSEGNVAVSFTTAGHTMMPTSRYDVPSHTWVSLSDEERTRMSERYNLRVGIMIAALCFGVDEHVSNVSVRIDSMGLEEAVEQQDSAISKLMAQALGTFERMHSGDMRKGGSKADPKDGDIHGDPSRPAPMGSAQDGGSFGAPPAQAFPSSGNHESSGSEDDMHRQQYSESQDDIWHGHNDDTDAGNRDQETSGFGCDAKDEDIPFASDEDNSGSAQTQSENDDTVGDAQIEAEFTDLMAGVDFDSIALSVPQGDQQEKDSVGNDEDEQVNPLALLHSGPTMHNMVSVTFTRERFLDYIRSEGLSHPEQIYTDFGASLNIDGTGSLDVYPQFTLRDKRFSPLGSQEEPELSDATLRGEASKILGADNIVGLSVQRADLLQRAVSDFHRIAESDSLPSVAKAQRAMALVEENGDPELNKLAPSVSRALIDGVDTPNLDFTLSQDLDAQRVKARDLLFSGQVEQAITTLEDAVERVDELYADGSSTPRYFNSYAERVVYNRLFATSDERTVLIPDNLFYAHMELADLLAQLQGAKAALPHLNAMVAYAPTYPLSHMRLAVQLAREEDWNSARAACLNALRVSLDRDDAAYAYYRLAYAEWMCGDFDVAVASYIMSEHISPSKIASLDEELQELLARAQSQCILVPTSFRSAQKVLTLHELPVWPHTEVAEIVHEAARVCVDTAMFVPARTLSIAAARMDDSAGDGIDMAQGLFLRSLNV